MNKIQLIPDWRFPRIDTLNRPYSRGPEKVSQYVDRITEDGGLMMDGMDPGEVERYRLREAVSVSIWA